MENILAKLTTADKIAILAIVVPAAVVIIGGIIKRFWPKKKKDTDNSSKSTLSQNQKFNGIKGNVTEIQAGIIEHITISTPDETPRQREDKLEKNSGPVKKNDGKGDAEEPFDVFLSHNSKDEAIVIQLAEKLKEYGLRVWLAVWELVPGQSWQEALEEIIQSTKSAAILVGKDGMGPWEILEMRACLYEFVKRKRPTIPVLLPGTPKQPELPLFLRQFQWVDLKDGLTKDGIEQLIWGITGKHPELKPDVEKTNALFDGVREKLAQINDLRSIRLIDDKIALKYQSKLLDRLIEKEKSK